MKILINSKNILKRMKEDGVTQWIRMTKVYKNSVRKTKSFFTIILRLAKNMLRILRKNIFLNTKRDQFYGANFVCVGSCCVKKSILKLVLPHLFSGLFTELPHSKKAIAPSPLVRASPIAFTVCWAAGSDKWFILAFEYTCLKALKPKIYVFSFTKCYLSVCLIKINKQKFPPVL